MRQRSESSLSLSPADFVQHLAVKRLTYVTMSALQFLLARTRMKYFEQITFDTYLRNDTHIISLTMLLFQPIKK